MTDEVATWGSLLWMDLERKRNQETEWKNDWPMKTDVH